jgi:hypothetical protein
MIGWKQLWLRWRGGVKWQLELVGLALALGEYSSHHVTGLEENLKNLYPQLLAVLSIQTLTDMFSH